MQKRNQIIEFVRSIACVFVVFIHVRFPNPYGLWVVGIGRFAVPFFAMVSGYFCNKDSKEESLHHIKKHLIGIIKITVLGAIIAVIANSITSLIAGNGVFYWALKYINRRTIINFVLFNRAVLLNSAMWYLFAMIYSYILLYVLVRVNLIRFSLIPAILLIAFNLYFCEFSGHSWYYCGNFLFELLPLVIIGFHFEKLRRIRITLTWQIIILCVGIILSAIEISVFYNDAPMYIGSTISALMIFYICLSNPPIKSNPISYAGSRWTMLIYILHCSIRDIIGTLIPGIASLFYFPVVVLFVSIIIAAICWWWMQRRSTT